MRREWPPFLGKSDRCEPLFHLLDERLKHPCLIVDPNPQYPGIPFVGKHTATASLQIKTRVSFSGPIDNPFDLLNPSLFNVAKKPDCQMHILWLRPAYLHRLAFELALQVRNPGLQLFR